MRVFFFDDVRQPLEPDWVLAKNVPEAKEVLKKETFDIISLDHDIGMQMMCEKCYNEIPKPVTINDTRLIEKLRTGCSHMEHGTDLAKWMLDHVKTWPQLIVIHSANHYAAERMHDLLCNNTRVVIVPFTSLQYKVLFSKAKGEGK